ncbi:glycosyltransferase [Streptomyces sp. NE5-10]|uniref:glycosyltransferase n=1 Tax=Streptomyces sp. NE5-10 TaxID=2759674 RepID=UPI001904A531|nr:glycosyltransferase [Streptomyces sp. NE5-10]
MGPATRRPRVLLVTPGPLDGRDGTDIALATAVAEVMTEADFVWFARRPRRSGPSPVVGGRPVPVYSRDGLAHGRQRLQVALRSVPLARGADLAHVVMTIGPGYPRFSRVWPRLIGGTPVLHTVPGVAEPELLRRARPLGTTVALSDVTARQLGGAGFGDVAVVLPMIRLDRWPLVPRPVDGPPTVLVTGHHDPLGGASDAIRAAAVAVRAGARMRLLLALRERPGQDVPALERGLRERAAREGLFGTDVLGRVDDVQGLLAASDVLLFLPRDLGGKADIPLTVLEALATGRPVILSDLPEFAVLRDAVLRTPPGDAHRAGHLLRQLLDRPWWWQSLAEQGRATVRRDFTPERFRARYAALYRRLLS